MAELRKAELKDQDALTALLLENDMEYTESVDDFLLALENNEIVGCARLEEYDSLLMIRPVVVAKGYRGQGIGRLLLESIMPSDRPTALAARGDAIEFYRAVGFLNTEWEMLPPNQREECMSCPDLAECQPQPMIHNPF
jgi:N-acetylglutamate synthase-like GNAT family acetyltransferase